MNREGRTGEETLRPEESWVFSRGQKLYSEMDNGKGWWVPPRGPSGGWMGVGCVFKRPVVWRTDWKQGDFRTGCQN